MRTLVAKCIKDETGGEVLEYALLLGLVVVGALGIMSALGIKVVMKWQSLFDSI